MKNKFDEFILFCNLYKKETGENITQKLVDRYEKIYDHITTPSTWFPHPNGVVVKGNVYKFWKKQSSDCKLGLMHIPLEEDSGYVHSLHTVGIVEDFIPDKILEVMLMDGFLAFDFELDSNKNRMEELKNYE